MLHLALATVARYRLTHLVQKVKWSCVTKVTTEPGPDVAPYHGRQVALLGPGDHEAAAGDLLGPALAGSVVVPADRVGN